MIFLHSEITEEERSKSVVEEGQRKDVRKHVEENVIAGDDGNGGSD